MKPVVLYLSVFVLISTSLFSKKLKEGVYRGVLTLNETNAAEVPFTFDVIYKNKKPLIIIHNADEKIVVDEITIKGDSVNFKMPVFDTEFRTRLSGDSLQGLWINHYKTANNKIKFKAVYGQKNRFLFSPANPDPLFEGKWEVTFSPGLKDSSKAMGMFHHQEQTDYVSGTFLTETGDYRYLEGMKHGNSLILSGFDGSHAYLFTVEYKNGALLNGKFYSGTTWQESWTGKRNESFKLADAEEITFVKDKTAKLEFSFPDTENKMVSLNDKKFENKPVIIQIMGSWCPNCMDESVYFSQLYKQYHAQGLEIIALAFEKTTEAEKARSQVQRMKARLKLDYDILITRQTGKDKASETLTALNKIAAFPTSIFLNRQHQVVKIHSGFSGPATGQEYETFKQSTENFIQQLLKE